MDKNEFLNVLKESLEGEVDNNILEQSLRFYNGYISSQSDKSEEEILKELGNPRLIAKTIIDTENASRQRESSSWSNYNGYSDESSNPYHRSTSNKRMFFKVKWYHKLFLTLILLLISYILIRVGLMILKLLFAFSLPVLFIILIFTVFRKR